MAINCSVTPLISLDAVAIDTETTGLDARNARIVELAEVRIARGRLDESQSLRHLVKPDIPIPAAASGIHGIDDTSVAKAPLFAEVWPEVQSWLGDAILVGHNVSFDLAVLRYECERAGIAWTSPPSLCTRLLAEVAEPGMPDYSLDSVAIRLGVAIEGRHSALGDAIAAGKIFCDLVPKLRERGVRTVAEAFRASAGLTRVVEDQIRAGWAEPVMTLRQPAPYEAARQDVFPYRHRVGSLMKTPAISSPQDTTVAAALELMMRQRISSLFVLADGDKSRPEDTGIVTERDLLRVLNEHGAAALAMPIGRLMSKPLAAVPADALAYAAIARMNRLKIRHLGVMDTSGKVIGALSARDLLRWRAESAVELGDEIEQSKDVHDLGRAWARLPQIAETLVQEGLSAGEIATVISQRLREMTQHAAALAEIAMRETGQGEPPCRYAIAVLGSAGRDESLLAMDQDNALVFEDAASAGVDAWFEALAVRTNDILHAVGIPLCKGGVMARNPQWRGSLETWRRRVAQWIAHSDPRDLLAVDIFFDLRFAHGDTALAESLWRHAFDAAGGQAIFAKLLIETAAFVPAGRTWYGGIRTEQGRINLKKAGLFGIVTTARALAICHHVVERTTPARLQGLGRLGLGLQSDLDALIEAQDVFLDLMLRQQIEDIQHGRPADNTVEVRRLSRRNHKRLHAALRSVEHLDTMAHDLLFRN